MDVATKKLRPQMKGMSSRWKGMISNFYLMYYPGRRRNKYTIMIMSHSPWRKGLPEALEMLEMCLWTWREISFTRLGGVLHSVSVVLEP